jgi:hypothetical protein
VKARVRFRRPMADPVSHPCTAPWRTWLFVDEDEVSTEIERLEATAVVA